MQKYFVCNYPCAPLNRSAIPGNTILLRVDPSLLRIAWHADQTNTQHATAGVTCFLYLDVQNAC